MPAALFTITINTTITEQSATGPTTLTLPVTLTGNHLEKLNVDVPAATTTDISVPLPINVGIDFIGMAASGADITVTTDDDDDSHDTFTVIKGQPFLYFPGGATRAPFAHRVTRLHLHNADTLKPAVFHMRILRDCTVVGDDD